MRPFLLLARRTRSSFTFDPLALSAIPQSPPSSSTTSNNRHEVRHRRSRAARGDAQCHGRGAHTRLPLHGRWCHRHTQSYSHNTRTDTATDSAGQELASGKQHSVPLFDRVHSFHIRAHLRRAVYRESRFETCAAKPGCLAYSFYPSKTPTECMLYKWIGNGYEVDDDVKSGTMLTVNSSCSLQLKTSFTGDVLSVQNGETVEDCCTTCKTKTGCNGFSFRSTGTRTVCQYLANTKETEEADLVTSGTI